MANINLDIIFPLPTATDPSPQPVVIPAYAVAKQFDRINWTVYAVNPAIAQAEIEFAGALGFFGPSNKFKKSVNGKATIYADVPDLNQTRPVGAKYTVRGLNAGNTIIAEIDPEIIVDEP